MIKIVAVFEVSWEEKKKQVRKDYGLRLGQIHF